MAGHFSREQMMEMDPLFLRMHLRERVHHTVEHQLYSAIFAGRQLGPRFGAIAREILDVWEDRGLPRDLPDIKWIYTLMDLAETAKRGEKPEPPGGYLPEPLNPDEMKAWEKLLFSRRSYRHWDERPVPAWMVERILEAGMWAASGCNLEIWRFVVMQDPDILHEFANMEFEVERVKIVCCMDVRGYRDVDRPPPEKNKLLDIGACMQNMALMAHALGLGGCWSTFSPEQIDGIAKHFGLPDYVEPVTYLSLGWAAERVMPPARMSFKDAILAWPGREGGE
ncbi:MAG: nitroreductase family protein [Bacillota bacterium]|nr:nitroreductase family protein [Bacillota bacterium]